MNDRWEIRAAMVLIVILLILALGACGQVPFVEQVTQSQENQAASEQVKEDNGPTNFQGIANALGCVFAPDSCSNR